MATVTGVAGVRNADPAAPRRGSEASFTQLSEPTELQARALALVDAKMPKLT